MEKYWSEDLINKINEIAIAKAKEISRRKEGWIKCEGQMPKKDGRYLVVEEFSGNYK